MRKDQRAHSRFYERFYWRWGHEAGFTLIELVVTLVLLGIVAVLATRVLSTSLDMWITTGYDARERADQVAALERMVREVREAKEIKFKDSNKTLEIVKENGPNVSFRERDESDGGDNLEFWRGDARVDRSLCLIDLENTESNSFFGCDSGSDHLLRLSLSAEVKTHVYPRNADCP
ncbi:MAG: PilW family protein [Halorhodospira sp.]